MKSIKVSSDRDYKVVIGANWSNEKQNIETRHGKVLYIIPKSLREILKLGSLENTYFTPDAESQKSAQTLESPWHHCGEIGLRRDDAIVAIGGGATTDLGGFVEIGRAHV